MLKYNTAVPLFIEVFWALQGGGMLKYNTAILLHSGFLSFAGRRNAEVPEVFHKSKKQPGKTLTCGAAYFNCMVDTFYMIRAGK